MIAPEDSTRPPARWTKRASAMPRRTKALSHSMRLSASYFAASAGWLQHFLPLVPEIRGVPEVTPADDSRFLFRFGQLASQLLWFPRVFRSIGMWRSRRGPRG